MDDLGLNWDSFKWRNHQPDIGRFFNVDPLAENYYYNSPYAFSENKVVAHVELEGLESAGYMIKRELEQKAGFLKEKFENGVGKVGSFVSAIWNAPKNVPKESTDKNQDGTGINIYDESGAGEDNKYVPSPDPDSKNYDLEKSVLDGVLQSTKSPSPSTPKDIGERAKNIATGTDKAAKGAEKLENGSGNKSEGGQQSNTSQQSGQSGKFWTTDSIKVIWGTGKDGKGDSVSWINNKKQK